MNRIILITLSLFFISILAGPALAKEPPRKGVALGFLGVGDLDSDAQPTLRWKFANRHAFDFTPDISISDSDSSGNGSDTDSFSLGLDFSWIMTLAQVQNMNVNIMTQTGLNLSRTESKFRSAGVTTSKFETDAWSAKIGFGPDFEYFFPFFPHLSIGAHALLILSHTETKSKSTSFTSNTTTSSLSKNNSLSWGGQVFNLRYYFGGINKYAKRKGSKSSKKGKKN